MSVPPDFAGVNLLSHEELETIEIMPAPEYADDYPRGNTNLLSHNDLLSQTLESLTHAIKAWYFQPFDKPAYRPKSSIYTTWTYSDSVDSARYDIPAREAVCDSLRACN